MIHKPDNEILMTKKNLKNKIKLHESINVP